MYPLFISNSDVWYFYLANAAIIDFFIFFILFTAIARLSLHKAFKEESRSFKLLTVAVGLSLSVAAILWEASQNFQLTELKVNVFIIVVFGVILGITLYFKSNRRKALYLIACSFFLLHVLQYFPIDSYYLYKLIRSGLFFLLFIGISCFIWNLIQSESIKA